MYKLVHVGDVITRTNGPHEGKPLKVVSVYNDFDGNERISCVVVGEEETSVKGVRRSFRFYTPYDGAQKLTPCWEYMCSKYKKCSNKDVDTLKQLYDWHHIRGLACHLNGCNKVEDIPDGNVEKTRKYCNKMIDLYFSF